MQAIDLKYVQQRTKDLYPENTVTYKVKNTLTIQFNNAIPNTQEK